MNLLISSNHRPSRLSRAPASPILRTARSLCGPIRRVQATPSTFSTRPRRSQVGHPVFWFFYLTKYLEMWEFPYSLSL